jgi:hypothetical protein
MNHRVPTRLWVVLSAKPLLASQKIPKLHGANSAYKYSILGENIYSYINYKTIYTKKFL